MEGAVRSVRRSRTSSVADRPGGGLVDAVAVGIGGREPREAGPRPRVERDADRGGEHAGAKRADDAHVCGVEALGERLELAQQDGAGAGVRAVLAAGALDLPPSALRVDLEADEELVIASSRPGRVLVSSR